MEKQLTALPVNSIISYIENTVPYMHKENSYMGLLWAWRLAKNSTVTVESNRGTSDQTSRR